MTLHDSGFGIYRRLSVNQARYRQFPAGTPLTSWDLAALGISTDLVVDYVRAGWLTRLARGVFCRPNGPPALHPSLLLLQRRLDGLHVGGRSALDWYVLRDLLQHCTSVKTVRLCLRLGREGSLQTVPALLQGLDNDPNGAARPWPVSAWRSPPRATCATR